MRRYPLIAQRDTSKKAYALFFYLPSELLLFLLPYPHDVCGGKGGMETTQTGRLIWAAMADMFTDSDEGRGKSL